MDTVDKLFFVFNAYDFNSIGSLCYDELSLLLRSAVKGLQKACPDAPVFSLATGVEVEAYADLIFASAGLTVSKGSSAAAGKNDKTRVLFILITNSYLSLHHRIYPLLTKKFVNIGSFKNSD
jgi:hypothetical protein